MPTALSETPTVGLGQLIKESRFDVPAHQRDYAWTESEINKFFDDVESAMERQDDLYFLGLMVFQVGERGILTVLDGQQRLATTVIVLSTIRNWLQQYTEYRSQAQRIEDWFIGFSELGEDNISARMTLNSANNEAFSRFVINSVPLDDVKRELSKLKKQDRNRPLLEAILLCKERVERLVTKGRDLGESAQRLYEFVNSVRDTVSIVRLVVRSDDAAYTIFETLNDRGLDLSPLDLVKNFLFSRAEKKSKARVRDLEARWAEMMALLSDTKANVFLKVFWTSRHGVVQSPTLYKSFKKDYNEPNAALQVSVDLRAAAERYAALESPEDVVWSGHFETSKETIRALKTVGAKQTHPVILAALERFSHPEMERLLRLLEVLIVRFQLIGSGRPGRLESTCGRLAVGIHRREIVTATQAYTEFRDIYPSDSDFQREFQNARNIENRKVQYLLNRLERQARRAANMPGANEFVPKSSTVEHILPKKPGSDWKRVIDEDREIVEECSTMLGNLCILGNVNKELGNKSFSEKKPAFKESTLVTTSEVTEYPDWDRAAIERRQAELARYAVAAWRFQ